MFTDRLDLDWSGSPEEAHQLNCCGIPRRNIAFDLFGGGDGPDYGAAAAAQSAATERAAQIEKQMYDQTRADLMPGITAYARTEPYIGGLLGVPGYDQVDPTQALRATPGYDFTMQQGSDALGRYAAARGMSMSGPQMKALQTFGQGTADQTYQKYMANLMGYAGGGQQAAAQTGKFGMDAAAGMGSAYMQGGEAQANAILSQGLQRQSGYNSGMSGLGSLLGVGLGIGMAPFTGGTSLIGSAMSGLGGLFGGGGGGGSSLYGVSNAYNPGMNMQW